MQSKYLILFPVPEPESSRLISLMDKVASHTRLPAPHTKLPPHVTFHPPVVGIDERVILDLTRSVALQSRQTRMTVSHIDRFGKHFMVLPVHATLSLASFWVGLTQILAQRPEYQHGEFDHDNTLHITIAEKTSDMFDIAWPLVKNLFDEEMNIPVCSVALYRKPIEGGGWEKLEELAIPQPAE